MSYKSVDGWDRIGIMEQPRKERPSAAGDEVAAVAGHGRICAVATYLQRDLQGRAAAHPELFEAKPFDGTMYAGIAMANAFGSPDGPAPSLEVAARTSLWIFALDWLVDHRASGRADVAELVDRCKDVAEGKDPDGPLTRFLAEIRDRLAESPGFARFEGLWRDELVRMLDAMALELEWKTGERPGFDAYIANADNFGSTWVNVAHWIATSDPGWADHREPLLEASREVQRVLRLLNDLATYERDVAWGDLNPMLLGMSRDAVRAQVGERVARSRELIGKLRRDRPREAVYLERQIGYSTGFYGAADYWGDL